jgi:nicotinate-nucleotide pyrophosphorylase
VIDLDLTRGVGIGSIPEAVKAARSVCGFSLRIDVECTSEEEAIQAIEAGADIIMLDNFTPQGLQVSSRNLKQKYGGSARFLIEVSGGITEENLTRL